MGLWSAGFNARGDIFCKSHDRHFEFACRLLLIKRIESVRLKNKIPAQKYPLGREARSTPQQKSENNKRFRGGSYRHLTEKGERTTKYPHWV